MVIERERKALLDLQRADDDPNPDRWVSLVNLPHHDRLPHPSWLGAQKGRDLLAGFPVVGAMLVSMTKESRMTTPIVGLTSPLRVFLCHASADKEPVRALYRRLRDDGLQPWLDEEDLQPGQQWRREIPKAVRAADIVLVCLSNRSIAKSGYVQKEIAIALDAAEERPEGTIYIVPTWLEECEVPERLRDWQWVDQGLGPVGSVRM